MLASGRELAREVGRKRETASEDTEKNWFVDSENSLRQPQAKEHIVGLHRYAEHDLRRSCVPLVDGVLAGFAGGCTSATHATRRCGGGVGERVG
jgi:hypothetical protein